MILILLAILAQQTSSTSLDSPIKRVRIEDLQKPTFMHRGVYSRGTTLSGRVVEVYSREHEAHHGLGVSRRLVSQTRLDEENDAFTPNASLGFQQTPLGNFTLGSVLYRGQLSIIFNIVERPDLLIKYQSDCDDVFGSFRFKIPTIHPLLRDVWYGVDADRWGIAVGGIFVSPPSFLCPEKTGICDFTVSDSSFEQCKKDLKSTLRYAVLRKSHGTALMNIKRSFVNGVVPLKTAFAIGIHLISLLQKLHEDANIIHGDLHLENIMIEDKFGNRTSGESVLKLIDFGKSHAKFSKPSLPVLPPRALNHTSCTIWQIDGFEMAARDDVMKAIQGIAVLMNPWKYRSYESVRLANGYEDYKSFKMAEDFFTMPEFDPIENASISDVAKSGIRQELATILALVRDAPDINSIPHYGAIISSFQHCISFLADR